MDGRVAMGKLQKMKTMIMNNFYDRWLVVAINMFRSSYLIIENLTLIKDR